MIITTPPARVADLVLVQLTRNGLPSLKQPTGRSTYLYATALYVYSREAWPYRRRAT